jgi:hypothetical protein
MESYTGCLALPYPGKKFPHGTRKGLKRYPFDAAGGKRYKRKARFLARSAKNAPKQKGKIFMRLS